MICLMPLSCHFQNDMTLHLSSLKVNFAIAQLSPFPEPATCLPLPAARSRCAECQPARPGVQVNPQHVPAGQPVDRAGVYRALFITAHCHPTHAQPPCLARLLTIHSFLGVHYGSNFMDLLLHNQQQNRQSFAKKHQSFCFLIRLLDKHLCQKYLDCIY